MTSTITAESRAKAIVQRIAGSDPWADDALDEMTALIAAAIRDAEDSVHERINRELSLTYIACAEGNTDFADGVPHALERAASLKSPSPPKDQGCE